MAQEQKLSVASDLASPESSIQQPDAAEPSLSRSSSGSRLNARAPEFIPRSSGHRHPNKNQQKNQYQRQHRQQRLVPIHHYRGPPPLPGPPPPPPPAHLIHVYHPHQGIAYHAPPAAPIVHGHGSFEYYGGGGGFSEQDQGHVVVEHGTGGDADGNDGLTEEVIHKVTKQVEYYFSDINLATTEHLIKFISKDPDGYVPLSVIAPFKKIRSLISDSSQLAAALRSSSKLVVSDDGKKVRRQQPLTEADLEELQSRIVVAENLPEDHCYQNLVKVFSVVGNVKTIRTCYPQPINNVPPANARPGKMDTFLLNKLHAFVEYETVEDAEKAVAELNVESNWRSGLRVRFPPKNMRHVQGRGRKVAFDGDGNVGDGDLASNENSEDHSEPTDACHDFTDEGNKDGDGGPRRQKGRGRGGGRGRGQYHYSKRDGGHSVGVSPNSPVTVEHILTNKQPPGPRMPDGTRGFTMGRGKPITLTGSTA